MILQAEILKLLKTIFTDEGYRCYAYLAPDDKSVIYPFIVYSTSTSLAETTFKEDLEYINVNVSVFNNDSAYTETIEIMNEIEELLHRQTFTITTGEIVCIKKVSENIIRASNIRDGKADDFYVQGVQLYQFLLQKDA